MAEAPGELNAAAMTEFIALSKELYKQDRAAPAAEMTRQQAECHERYLTELLWCVRSTPRPLPRTY
eukprot:evm.model.NODE_27998_length_27464_cov_27.523705.7